MIARYETEWWSELLKTTPNDDYPAIIYFFKRLAQNKTPFLVCNWLMNRKSRTSIEEDIKKIRRLLYKKNQLLNS